MSKFTDRDYVVKSQYKNSQNLLSRRSLYSFLVPPMDIRAASLRALHLDGNERVLDAGCGDGAALIQLQHDFKHRGSLVGLDISRGMFLSPEKLRGVPSSHRPITFVEASADHIPFSDASFDAILAFFMLYHMADIPRTLHEWNRVLSSQGKLIVTTNSIETRPKHHTFKAFAAQLLGCSLPSSFSSLFNMENGEKQLSSAFRVVDKFVYEGELRLSGAQPFISAFDSIRDTFDPYPSDSAWASVLISIKEKFETEIKKNGCFIDKIKRGYFLCMKW